MSVHFILVLILVCSVLAVSHFLGQRHSDRATGTAYESGIVSEGDAHVRLHLRFYMLAILFVVFDLETTFLVVWAVAARELGWAGYMEMAIFVSVFAAALAYLWRMGVLDWNSSGKVGTERDRQS